MKTLVFDPSTYAPPLDLLQWTAQRWGEDASAFNRFDARAICLMDDDFAPVCVVVCDNFKASDQCHVCIGSDETKRAGTRAFIRLIYQTIFEGWKMNRMHMYVSKNNQDAINMHIGLGHVQEGVARDFYGCGKDGILFGFTAKDWATSKWNPHRTRKKGDNINVEQCSEKR